MRCGLTALGALLLLSAPAAGSPMTLQVVEAESSIALEQGGATPLRGDLTVDVGALPPPGATTFDLIALSVTSGTGLQIGLDPSVPSPGLGVLNDQGDFLIPTLFLAVDGPNTDPFELALQNVMGTAAWEGSTLTRLDSTFQIDAPGVGGMTVTVAAVVPEPSTFALFCVGLLALGLAARPAPAAFASVRPARAKGVRR